MTCRSCSQPMRPGRTPPDGYTVCHHSRGLCGACYSREHKAGRVTMFPTTARNYQQERRHVVEAIEAMMVVGLPPEKWCAELGTTPAALERRLYRSGRPDLARKL